MDKSRPPVPAASPGRYVAGLVDGFLMASGEADGNISIHMTASLQGESAHVQSILSVEQVKQLCEILSGYQGRRAGEEPENKDLGSILCPVGITLSSSDYGSRRASAFIDQYHNRL